MGCLGCWCFVLLEAHVEQGRGLHLFRLIGSVKEDAVLDLVKERNPWLRLHRYLPLSADLLILEVDASGLLRLNRPLL